MKNRILLGLVLGLLFGFIQHFGFIFFDSGFSINGFLSVLSNEFYFKMVLLGSYFSFIEIILISLLLGLISFYDILNKNIIQLYGRGFFLGFIVSLIFNIFSYGLNILNINGIYFILIFSGFLGFFLNLIFLKFFRKN